MKFISYIVEPIKGLFGRIQRVLVFYERRKFYSRISYPDTFVWKLNRRPLPRVFLDGLGADNNPFSNKHNKVIKGILNDHIRSKATLYNNKTIPLTYHDEIKDFNGLLYNEQPTRDSSNAQTIDNVFGITDYQTIKVNISC